MYMNRNSILSFLLLLTLPAAAQIDTTKSQSVEIISSYKPVLRNATKIPLSGSQLQSDTNRTVSAYQIPVQQLFYSYEPAKLNALSIDTDAEKNIGTRHYLKAGFGSMTTPYVKGAVVLGDEQTALLNIYLDHISSRGALKHQDLSKTSLKGVGTYIMDDFELTATAGVDFNHYKLYGYDHSLYAPDKDSVKQHFRNIYLSAGLQNIKPGPWGIDYNPTLKLSMFNLSGQLNEFNVVLKVPTEKKLREDLLLKLSADIDFTRHVPTDNAPGTAFSNTIIRLSPAAKYFGAGAYIHAGISPVFYNSNVSFLPDVYFEVTLQERLTLQGGWIGRVQKNTVSALYEVNPFIRGPFTNINTKETEFYGGARVTVGSHLNISGKVSWVSSKNAVLFLNDTTAITNHFITGVETKLNNLRIHGNLSYVLQDKFTINGAVTLNAFNSKEVFSKAWNMLPLEINGSVRFQLMKRLALKGDVYVFGGAKTFDKNKGAFTMSGGTDLSVGATYTITDRFSAWLDVNNLLNDKYSRWNNYSVYGLNLLGGIIIHF